MTHLQWGSRRWEGAWRVEIGGRALVGIPAVTVGVGLCRPGVLFPGLPPRIEASPRQVVAQQPPGVLI